MRRTLVMTVAVGAAAAVALPLWFLSSTLAQPRAPRVEPAASATGPQLPISQVVLFSSGVGYFQRQGEVEGHARVDLTFPVSDVNDLLKSMVLQDLGGGHVSAVSYDSHDPIERTLKSYAVDLTDNPTLSELLTQARGEKVEVVLQQSNTAQPGTITGAIMGTESQRQQFGKDAFVETEVLNLWCAEGIRSVKLSELQRVRFLNPVMEGEVKRALETLTLSHDAQKKAVSISFAGEGKRPVRVSYVIENPIWKTSYRLVLGREKEDGKASKPFLQGWAIVENPSDEDWRDVRMALISGRPISFQMDLYQPLYVPRPVVEPELFASLRPPTYQGAMQGQGGVGALGGLGVAGGGALGFAGGGGLGGAQPTMKLRAPVMTSGQFKPPAGEALKEELAKDLELQQGVQSAAAAGQLGDFFQYVIEHPVSLARQKSAMLPIVQKEVEGTRVSIYNEGTHAKFPLLGLRFKNTSGLHLMQGPITVFEGSNYAGDARVLDLQPGEERLLSYAIDLGTEVEPVAHKDPDRLSTVKLVKGVLVATSRMHEKKTYNVKNRSPQDRTILIEHPFRPDFTLVGKDKPAERARDVYRFELKVPAGKSARQEVVEERDVRKDVALSNSDDQTIQFYFNSSISSAKVKAALEKVLGLKSKLAATQREVQHQQGELTTITKDQERLRANLREMPQTAAAYKRYLEKFDKQETEIEAYQARIKKLQADEHDQRKALDDFLLALDLE